MDTLGGIFFSCSNLFTLLIPMFTFTSSYIILMSILQLCNYLVYICIALLYLHHNDSTLFQIHT
jgi:hypothetical protein